jgi:phosphohistidine phosphatase
MYSAWRPGRAPALVLVRHAIAEDRQAGKPDAELTAHRRGAASWRGPPGLAPGSRAHEPSAARRETAALLVEVLAPKLKAEVCAAPGPGHPQSVLEVLGKEAAGTIVLVGHEPDLGELASWLLTGSAQAVRIQFRKGGAVAIELQETRRKGPGSLRWMLAPRQLRALGEE